MSIWIFLDDERQPPSKPIFSDLIPEPMIARTYDEFVQLINDVGCPAFITFDHDLGEGKTGMDCAIWFTNWLLDDPARLVGNFRYDIHSQNPIGAANIRHRMDRYLEYVRNEQ